MRRTAVTPRPIKKATRPIVVPTKKRRWWSTIGGALYWVLDLLNLVVVFKKMIPGKDPATGKRRNATFLLWIFGIYAAMYGIASARYESALDRLEIRANVVMGQMINEKTRARACAQIGELQRVEIPLKPAFLSPRTTWLSFFGAEEIDKGTVKLLMDTVVSLKKELQGAMLHGVKLNGADLRGAILPRANLSGADLDEAHLREADLRDAWLWRAYLYKADLRGAILTGANLSGASLTGANMSGANLRDADLAGSSLSTVFVSGADLSGADLHEADLSEANLIFANLTGANLTSANLSGADLTWIRNWKSIRSINNTNIYRVKNAPEGFIEWALANGACEMEDVEAWRKNGCPPQEKQPEPIIPVGSTGEPKKPGQPPPSNASSGGQE